MAVHVIDEANRCLQCKKPMCQQGCPIHTPIPAMIRALKEGGLEDAGAMLFANNPMSLVCSLVCNHERQCEGHCVLGRKGQPVHVSSIENYISDTCLERIKIDCAQKNGKKVAVIGAGPAGLACAASLAALGYEADVLEADSNAAGVVSREIPGSRISMDVIADDLGELPADRIHITYNRRVTLDEMMGGISEQYDAVFMGAGLGRDRISGVEIGEGAPVVGCSSFLKDLKDGTIKELSGTVCVIGGGDSAIDAVRCSLDAGAEKAVLAYRRSRLEMPSCDEEFIHAALEGSGFMYLVSPKNISLKGEEAEITFVRNRMTACPDEGDRTRTGRRRFEAIPGSEFVMKASLVVLAIGKVADMELPEGNVDPDTLRVEGTNCFAGGDWYNGGATVVQAVSDGKKAAAAMDSYIRNH